MADAEEPYRLVPRGAEELREAFDRGGDLGDEDDAHA